MSSTEPQLGSNEVLARELAHVLEPVVEAVEGGSEGIATLIENAGLTDVLSPGQRDNLRQVLEDAIEPVMDVLTSVFAEGEEMPDVDEITAAIDGVYGAIKALDDVQFEESDDIGERLLDHLLISYLRDYHHGLYSGFRLFGVIVETDTVGPPRLELSTIAEVLRDPVTIQKQTFGWANEVEGFLAFVLLYYLKELFWALDLPASLVSPDIDEVATLNGVSDLGDLSDLPDGFEFELQIPVFALVDEAGTAVTGLKIVALPGDGEHLPGLALVPFGSLHAGEEWALGDGWTFNVRSTGALAERGFAVQPTRHGDVDTRLVDLGGGNTPDVLEANAEVRQTGEDTDEETVVLGTPGATRLAVRSLSARASLRYRSDEELVVNVEVPATGILGVHPSDFDGFLGSIFPTEGIFYDFDVAVGWSSQTGLYVERGGTLEVSLPQSTPLGPIDITEVYLAALPDVESEDGAISLKGALSSVIELGPTTATIQRMGIEADVSFPEDGGNFGPLSLDLGFKPPNGVGLSVDASTVVGGGYLYFDDEQQRYTGALTLKVGTLTLNALGLLTTRLPDGRDGFSLLVIITGEFPPVQLGFGFTLNAVGGLLGVNRSARVEPLRAGVKDNRIHSVLFPEDPIRNAPTLISDLGQFFPPTRDQHVFGPMGELGWGTPPIVRAQLGLLLELPSPIRLLILGRIRAALPAEEDTLLVLQMNALGVINFDENTAAIDASLYDSRVVTYTLTGDMAMRANWGDDPDFVLSVGGFHPRFDPPPEFPQLRRVTLALAAGDNLRLRHAGYFALTSNTAQVGASVDAYAAAGGFSVSGHLGYDALFQFDPFKFLVDFAAYVAVRGYGLSLGLGLEGSLEGPSPWRLRGRAYIDLFLFSATVRVDATIGEAASSPGIPPAEVFEEFRAALRQPGNWSAQLPEGGDSLVTLRKLEPEETELLAHPLGELSVIQRIVPMNVAIERYGNAEPADYHTFRISSVTVDGQANDDLVGAELDAQFAPAQFFDLTDSEKLSQPSFRPFPAGYRVTNGLLAYGGQPSGEGGSLGPEVAEQTLSYESSYIDEETDSTGAFFSYIAPATVAALSELSAVATSEARTTGASKFSIDEPPLISVGETQYTVVTIDTLEPVLELPTSGEDGLVEGVTYTQAKQARDAYAVANPGANVQVVATHELAGTAGGDA